MTRKKADDKRQTSRIGFTCTQEEEATIRALAEAHGINQHSVFVRLASLGIIQVDRSKIGLAAVPPVSTPVKPSVGNLSDLDVDSLGKADGAVPPKPEAVPEEKKPIPVYASGQPKPTSPPPASKPMERNKDGTPAYINGAVLTVDGVLCVGREGRWCPVVSGHYFDEQKQDWWKFEDREWKAKKAKAESKPVPAAKAENKNETVSFHEGIAMVPTTEKLLEAWETWDTTKDAVPVILQAQSPLGLFHDPRVKQAVRVSDGQPINSEPVPGHTYHIPIVLLPDKSILYEKNGEMLNHETGHFEPIDADWLGELDDLPRDYKMWKRKMKELYERECGRDYCGDDDDDGEEDD